MLHNLSTTANILCIQKLCTRNNVFVEIHLVLFMLKIKQFMLQDSIDNRFYKIIGIVNGSNDCFLLVLLRLASGDSAVDFFFIA